MLLNSLRVPDDTLELRRSHDSDSSVRPVEWTNWPVVKEARRQERASASSRESWAARHRRHGKGPISGDVRRYGASVNRLLREFSDLSGVPADGVVIVHGEDVLPSRLATTELAVGAVASAAAAASHLAAGRGGARPAAPIDGRRVSAAFRSDQLFRIDGRPVEGFARLSGFWVTADGWLRTHANYPHHRAALSKALRLDDSAGPDDLAGVLATMAATDAEEEIVAAGGVCAAVRGPDLWRRHPQAVALRQLPLLGLSTSTPAPPRRLRRPPTDPLLPAAGLRVLDLTRVIAGPVATRTLALLGADVLRVDAPRLPEIGWQHLDTGMGKRSALIDLDSHPQILERLITGADVVVTGYRPGALDRWGLSPEQLAERKPGLVIASLSAWGSEGPWGQRRGFDSIVQAATGIATIESTDGVTPGKLPAQALDHATGYLLAAGVLSAVAAQLHDGSTRHVQAHLARTAQWLLDHPDPQVRALPDPGSALTERATPSGRLRYPLPAVQIEAGPGDWAQVGSPWGTDQPT